MTERRKPGARARAAPPAGGPPSWRPLLLVAGVAAALRIAYLVLARRTPLFDYIHLDPRYYLDWGRRIAAGDLIGTEVFEQSPLYPYLLGGFLALFGERLLLLRVLQLGCGVLACLAIYDLSRRAFDRRIALGAGLLAAAYGPFLFYEGQVMKSYLTYTLTAAALATLYRSGGEARGWAFLSGLMLGLLALVRETALVLAPAWGAWLLLRRGRAGIRAGLAPAGALVLGTAAAVLPCAARNLAVSGDLVLITAGAGEVFYIGNYAEANGAYVPPPFVRPSPAYEHEDFRAEARRRTGGPLSRAESSRYWFREGVRTIASKPGRWLKLELRKLALFWNARELPDNYSFDLFARLVPLLRLTIPFGLVAPAALVGMALGLRRWRELLPLYLTVGAYLAADLLFFNFSRFRLPVLPALMAFAALAGVAALDHARGGRPRRAAAILAAAAALALPLHLDLSSVADAPGQEEVLLGFARLDAGNPAGAEGAFREARLAIEAFARERGAVPGRELGSACFGLGSALLAQGRAAEAIEPLRRASALSPEDPEPLASLARALIESGDDAEAERALERLVQIRPGRFSAHFDLASIAIRRGDAAEAIRRFERGRAAAGEMGALDLADYHFGVALVHLELRRDPAAAAPHLREVLRLAPGHAQADAIRRQLSSEDPGGSASRG